MTDSRLTFIAKLRADLDRDWMKYGACVGVSPAIFFPERGESTRPARAICHSCDVQEPCLEYALASKERHGVWGGEPERARRKMRTKRRAA